MEKNKTYALLPLKKNSERVKNKNFKDLKGKPLFMWILEKILDVDEIDKVVINTDARELLEEHKLVHDPKVIIRDRDHRICGDFVSMNKILKDDIENTDADNYIMTHTTNPLISTQTLRLALKKFYESNDNDSLFSVNRFQTRFYDASANPINHDPKNLIRTQDLDVWYEENSCIYVFSKESFLKNNNRIGEKPYMYCTPLNESFEIDTLDDWNLIETILSDE